MEKVKKLQCFCIRHPKIVLTIAIACSAALVYYQYVFGHAIFMFDDIGSDTQQQYIMQYNTIVNHLRDGNLSFWDFNNGFGTSMFQLTIADPSLWILYALGAVFGAESIAYLLIYIHIGKIVLAGLAGYLFLSCFPLSTKSKLLASYLYAFNGFIIVWGQHYQFSMVCVLLPLLLTAVEKAVSGKKFSFRLSPVVALFVFYSYYTGYMALLLSGTYVIFRLLYMELSWKERFVQVCKHAGAMLLGVGMALVTLLPNYYLVSNVSARMNSDMGLIQRLVTSFTKYPEGYYHTFFSRMISSNMEGIGNDVLPYTGYGNYYEAPTTFFSVLIVIILVQFLILIPKISKNRKQMLVWFAAAVLLAASMGIMTFSMIFNGFAYPFSRHTFILMPLFAYVTARTLDEIIARRKLNLIGLVVAVAAVLAVCIPAVSKAQTTPTRLNAVFICGCVLLMATVLVCMAFIKPEKSTRGTSLLFLLLSIITAGSVICDSHITARYRSEVEKGSEAYFEYLYGDDMQELMEYVNKRTTDFYRLEKNYSQVSICMESCAQDYRGIGTYNSTMNKNITEFVEKMCPTLWYENLRHLSFTQIQNDQVYAKFFGIQYVISQNERAYTGYQLVKQFGSLYLYESSNQTSIGHLYTKTIDAAAYEASAYELDTQALMEDVAVTDAQDAFTISSEELSGYQRLPREDVIAYSRVSDTDEQNVTAAAEEKTIVCQGEAVIPFDRTMLSIMGTLTMEFDITMTDSKNITFWVDDAKYTHTLLNGQVTHLKLTIPETSERLYIATGLPNTVLTLQNIAFYSSSADADMTAKTIQVNDTSNDSHVSGTIVTDENALAVFTIPYEEGWTVTIDGREAERVRADYGFTGVYVEAGEHEFSFIYRQPMLAVGILSSCVCWLMYAIIALIIKKREHVV